ncbi:hypothetical protein OAP73_06080 [Methylophilaceae bacterium]|nr:hypothetical protein [Methylophilaceae bacterium]
MKNYFKIMGAFTAVIIIGMIVGGASKKEIIFSLWNTFISVGMLAGILYAGIEVSQESKWQAWLLGIFIFCFGGFLLLD